MINQTIILFHPSLDPKIFNLVIPLIETSE